MKFEKEKEILSFRPRRLYSVFVNLAIFEQYWAWYCQQYQRGTHIRRIHSLSKPTCFYKFTYKSRISTDEKKKSFFFKGLDLKRGG